ncbi:hypothetical protein Tco_0953648 [Tanacetum coccineum]|uniref:Uncharacterized protein n=1 Tax=Tanacetum coccineum TaxID=301880 RepID=A0ABQ5E0W3_9ASTR
MKRDSKGYTRENIPLFPTMIVQGPVIQGEGSTYPVESHHTPTNAPSTSQPPISPTSKRTNRQESMVPQPKSPTHTPIADEAASIDVDVRYGGDTITVTGLEAGQDSANIDKTPTMPPRFTSPKIKSSQARRRTRIVVSDNEDDLDDPSKQGRKIGEIDQDPDISLVQHDAELQGRYRHEMEFKFDFDAAKEVSTADLDVSTDELVSTTGAAVTTARRVSKDKDKGNGKMDEFEPVQTKIKLQQEQERLGYEEAMRLQAKLEEEERVKADEELAQRLQADKREMYTEAEQSRMLVELINKRKRYFAAQRAEERRNKPPTQAHQRTYMSNYIKHIGSYTLQQVRGYSFNEIKTLFETTMSRVNNFVPIESKVDRAVPELAAGSSKRHAEEELDQESSKRQKTGESSELAEEPRVKEADELSQEELQQMMIIVLVDEYTNDKLLKLQNHIHDLTLRLYDSCGVHHVSTKKGIDIYMMVEKEYPLSRGTLTLMLVAKLLVDQDNEISREPLRKILTQAERPRR